MLPYYFFFNKASVIKLRDFLSKTVSHIHSNELRGIQLTTVVPVIKSSKDEQVPPIVWMTGKVNLANKPALWNFGDVDEECNDDECIHRDNSRNKHLKKQKFQ